MFGLTTAQDRLVNLSDGGHTGDNVGIYPLLQRRCRVIIACDAEADPQIGFGSLTEALRQAYIDMGVLVDIDLSMVRPDAESGLSCSHCAIGRIRYPDRPDQEQNWLIVLKNSMTDDEPASVVTYQGTHPDFPHQTTIDQFFDDNQFESYRALGLHLAEYTFGAWLSESKIREGRPTWHRLSRRHLPFRAAEAEEFQAATRDYINIERMFLSDPKLHEFAKELDRPFDSDITMHESARKLDRQSESAGSTPPADPNAVPVGRACAILIQLMEKVFFGLQLDLYPNAPDNRGWMNVFRRWGRSPTFKRHFELLKTNYSDVFVEFYADYVHDYDEPIEDLYVPHPWDGEQRRQHPRDPARRLAGVYLDPGIYEVSADGLT